MYCVRQQSLTSLFRASVFLIVLLPAQSASVASVSSFLKRHCAKCHNVETQKGKLNLLPVSRCDSVEKCV